MEGDSGDKRMKQVPKWVNADVFEELLKKDVENFEKIVDFKARPALNPGENYATLMVRVSIKAELKDKSIKDISYMMKLPHDLELMKQMLEMVNMFHIERDTLRNILPELEQMYLDVGQTIRFGPTSRLLPSDPNGNYVLMDDLGPLGWRNANRAECLDMAHVKIVLKKLAQYHAASAVRVAVKGPYDGSLMKGIDHEAGLQMFAGMIKSFEQAFMNNLKTFKDGEKYEASLKNFFKNLLPSLRHIMVPDPKMFSVLSHGDCWSNNFLFKYNNNNEVEGLTFVDFQMPRWGSPVVDVVYFIISSIRHDIKLTNFDYFIRFYYDHLIENLQLLKYPNPLPELKELFMEVFKYGSFAPITAIMVLPIVLGDSSDKSDFANFVSTEVEGMDFKEMLYRNKRYHTYINELLPWFYNRGFICEE